MRASRKLEGAERSYNKALIAYLTDAMLYPEYGLPRRGRCGAVALRLLQQLVVAVPLGQFRIRPTSQRPAVLLTDAFIVMGEVRGGSVQCCGPRALRLRAGLEGWLVAPSARLSCKNTYIAQGQLYAELCAQWTLPSKLRGRLVHHFVDNKAALAGSVSGYLGRPDSPMNALAVSTMWLRCYPWYGFVHFSLVDSLGARRCELVMPRLASLLTDEVATPGWSS